MKKSLVTSAAIAAALGALSIGATASQAQPRTIAGAACGPVNASQAAAGNATDPATGREFFIEFPCDLVAGEDVTFVLNIHGAGSSAGWQRQYFPAGDYADKYNLVVVTPTAATAEPIRVWTEQADDAYLQGLVNLVFDSFGRENIASFWLAGHSQGGATSHRIVCTPFFADKVDGLLSLAGGRIGGGRINEAPACQFSHIFTTGDQDSSGRAGVPTVSPVADAFNCSPRIRRAIIEDSEPGKVYDGRTEGRPSRAGWGGMPAAGDADVYVFPACDDGRIVADVIRLNKGHTEGLEPNVTEELVRLMISASGGKARGS